jgi:hypothetical protein
LAFEVEAMEFKLSDHAARRAAQRNLSHEEIDFLLEHGHFMHNTGVIFCQLRQKDVPDDLPGNHRFRRLVGSTAVLCKCGYYVVTLYREQRAFRGDSLKTRYSLRGERLTNCPYCNEVVA